MKVKELIEHLKKYNQEAKVLARCDGYGNVFELTKKDLPDSEVYEYGYKDPVIIIEADG